LSSGERAVTVVEAALVRRIATGDTAAIAEIYDRYASQLFPIALRIMRDPVEAEDILHDAFVVLSDRAGQYVEERGTVSVWLATLVRNLSLDRARRRKRRERITRTAVAHEPVAPVRTPERLASDAAEHDRVRQALAGLPHRQRQTLEVAFFEGLTYAEIAARENVTLATVKLRAARGLSSLRMALRRDVVQERLRAPRA
jgi:RNA polymerase sigma-70 factor (ECF subfamily)